jgi:hypothetical protein
MIHPALLLITTTPAKKQIKNYLWKTFLNISKIYVFSLFDGIFYLVIIKLDLGGKNKTKSKNKITSARRPLSRPLGGFDFKILPLNN